MDRRLKSYILYMFFAILAIILNIGTQSITAFVIRGVFGPIADLQFLSFEMWFIIALVAGTGVGFIFKFVVDKFIVFNENVSQAASTRTLKQLVIYFGFALLTTTIFWGTETIFKIFWSDFYLLGGIIGLVIGYTVKFLLDRQFCFDQVSYDDVDIPVVEDSVALDNE